MKRKRSKKGSIPQFVSRKTQYDDSIDYEDGFEVYADDVQNLSMMTRRDEEEIGREKAIALECIRDVVIESGIMVSVCKELVRATNDGQIAVDDVVGKSTLEYSVYQEFNYFATLTRSHMNCASELIDYFRSMEVSPAVLLYIVEFIEKIYSEIYRKPKWLSLSLYAIEKNEWSFVKILIEQRDIIKRAENKFVEANLRLVLSIARRYASKHNIKLSDIVQEGNIGLIRASEKFDYSRGYKFSTYSVWWIRQYISRYIADQGKSIRLPIKVMDECMKFNKAKDDLYGELHRDPTNKEIAHQMQIDVKKVLELGDISQGILSLDVEMENEDSLYAKVSYDDNYYDDLAYKEMINNLNLALGVLNEIDREILKMRFGVEYRVHTTEEISKLTYISKHRIKHIEVTSMEVLKKGSNDYGLDIDNYFSEGV